MKITGEVMNVSTDNRSIVDSKTGQSRDLHITNILLKDSTGEIFACRSFNALSKTPVQGKEYSLEVRKLEKQGLVNNVIF